MATTFLEPGGDADFLVGATNGFWAFSAGGATVATDFVHGNHIKSRKYTSTGSAVYVRTPNGAVNDSGTRISMYIYLVALPTGTSVLFRPGTTVWQMKITSAGVLQLFNATVQIGTNGATLSTGQWYRISIALTVTSTTVNRFEVFVDGVSSISVTNATLSGTGTSNFQIGNTSNDATLNFRSSDHYIDNSNSLTDTGNIWVTAKRPVSNGTTNGFSTQIGSGGSGYGSGHSPQVNERALSTTNGWSMVGAGSAVTEEYNVEGKAVGDLSVGTVIDWLGWASMSSLAPETLYMIVGGASVAQAITSTITLYTKIKGSSTYPAGAGTDIGITTDTTATTVSLYECGVIVAYIPTTATTLTATEQTYAMTFEDSLFHIGRKLLATYQTYSMTFETAIFKTGRKLIATYQTYAVTFENAILTKAVKIFADMQTYTVSFISAGIRGGKYILGICAVYTVTFEDAILTSIRTMLADFQTYALSLQDSFLIYGRSMIATFQNYAVSFRNSIFTVQRKFIATVQTYSMTFETALFKVARHLLATMQTYAVTFYDALIHAVRHMTATMRTYAVTFENAIFVYGHRLVATYQTFAVTFEPVILTVQRLMKATVQLYTLTGKAVRLLYNGYDIIYTNTAKSVASWINKIKS